MKNIEFYTTPEGEVEIKSEDGVNTYTREKKEITDFMYREIEENYPKAHKALCAEYKRSADNPPFFKFLLVHRFMRCNFGRYDHVADIDQCDIFHFERVECPLRDRECKLCGIVCNPEFNTELSECQMDVMRLYCQNVDCHDIAVRLNTSFDNVRKHIAHSYRRKGVHSRGEFIAWANDHNIFKAQ